MSTLHQGYRDWRRSGTIRSEDGLLDLARPTMMGGKGGATNLEPLFAAG